MTLNKTISKKIKTNYNKTILALGAEMTGSFAILKNKKIIVYETFKSINDYDEYQKYQEKIKKILKDKKIMPDIIVCDLHPTYNSTVFAKCLSKELKIPVFHIQHHIAHAYSVSFEHKLDDFISITCDGLGFGLDGQIWGGEIFRNDKRIGHLEYQTQLGGDLANEKPQRMLFSIMSKILKEKNNKKSKNNKLRTFMLKYITKEDFELFQKQLDSKINCPLTSSTGRILDAISVMLEFTDKGGGAITIENNSTIPYELEPIIENNILLTTPLFEFICKKINDKKSKSDKKRLAATAQIYLAKGLLKIAKDYAENNKNSKEKDKNKTFKITFTGGCAKNKLMSDYLKEKGVILNKNTDCTDAGIALGQIYYFISKKKN